MIRIFEKRALFVATAASVLFLVGADVFAQDKKPATNDAAGKQTPSQVRDAAVSIKANTKEVTITGEVVDTWCYCSGVMGDGRGEQHRKCARLCIGGGVTAGILADDGTLYIAAKHQGYKGCAGLLLPYAGKKVKAKGWLAERGGCKVLKINSVEPLTATKNSAKRP